MLHGRRYFIAISSSTTDETYFQTFKKNLILLFVTIFPHDGL